MSTSFSRRIQSLLSAALDWPPTLSDWVYGVLLDIIFVSSAFFFAAVLRMPPSREPPRFIGDDFTDAFADTTEAGAGLKFTSVHHRTIRALHGGRLYQGGLT